MKIIRSKLIKEEFMISYEYKIFKSYSMDVGPLHIYGEICKFKERANKDSNGFLPFQIFLMIDPSFNKFRQ